ncbi:MAG: TetR/AcrR family transcriptional regulator, partial [Candidatus Acidiferrales bacterium]
MAVKRRSIAKQKKHTGQRILSAAFKCISTKGSASVSLRDIADEAGVVLSQLNYYYDNREQLFAAVLRWMKEDYIANVEARMDSFGTLNEKARFLIQYNQDLLQTNRRLY